MGNIKLFKSQTDIEKIITEDNVINVIGTKGSGKTTSSLKYIDNDNYIVVNCDRLLELPTTEREDKELTNIRNVLNAKYGKITLEEGFYKYYNDIVEYIKSKNKIAIIEGNVIQDINPKLLKGKIVIKRTAKVKSYIRAVKRDYKNDYFMKKEQEKHKYFYKLTRFYNISKRRKSVFSQAKEIDEIIKKINK